MAIVLSYNDFILRQFIFHRGDGRDIRQVVGTDNHATSVDTDLPVGVLQFFGVGQHRGDILVLARQQFVQFRDVFVTILQVDLGHFLGQRAFHGFHRRLVEIAVRNVTLNLVHLGQRNLLHTPHIGNGRLGRHRAVSDDVRHLFLAVFLCHPVQYALAAIIIEVHVNIGQRDTVGVEETLKQQVVFQRIQVCDFQAIGHHRTSRRTTSRPDRNTQFFTRRTNIVAHDKEVARETHRFHHVQLKLDALDLLLGEVLAITLFCTIPSQFGQIIRFEFDTVKSIVTAQFLDLFLGLLLRHDDIAVLIAGELVEKVFFSEFLAVLFFRAKVLRNGENRHNRIGINAVGLNFIDNLLSVFQSKRHIGKNAAHLLWRLQPFLFSVVHPCWVVEVLARAEAYQAVMRLAMFFFHKVHIIGRDDLHIVFFRQLQKDFVHLLLSFVNFGVAARLISLMSLDFKIIILPKKVLEPLYCFLCTFKVAVHDFLRHLARETGRTANHTLMVLLQKAVVNARIIIETLRVGDGTQFAKAMVAHLVLGQQNQVPASVLSAITLVNADRRTIGFYSVNRLEELLVQFFDLLLRGNLFFLGRFRLCDDSLLLLDGILHLAVFLVHCVSKVLDTEHVAMVGKGEAIHAVFLTLGHQIRHLRHAVEHGIM